MIRKSESTEEPELIRPLEFLVEDDLDVEDVIGDLEGVGKNVEVAENSDFDVGKSE